MTFSRRLIFLAAFLATALADAASIDIVPPDFSGAIQPQIAIATDGRIHIVFGKGNAIYHVSSDDGAKFSPPVKVGELDKLALGRRRGPRIVATHSALVLTAISHADGNIHIWASGDTGQTWKERDRLNGPANSAREGLHAMAGDGRELIAVAWLDLRNGGTELWSRVSGDGGATWAPEARIYASPDGHICQCCHPSLAIGPHGEIVAAWRNSLDGSRDFWAATSSDRGQTFGPAQKLGASTWKLNACPMDGGAIALSADGHLTSIWRRENSVFLSTEPGAEIKLADRAAQPVVALAGNGSRFAWEQDGGVTVEFAGKPSTQLAPAAHFPAIAALSGGRALVAWEASQPGAAPLQCAILKP